MFRNLFNTKTKITKQQPTLTLKYYLPTVLLITLSIVNTLTKINLQIILGQLHLVLIVMTINRIELT